MRVGELEKWKDDLQLMIKLHRILVVMLVLITASLACNLGAGAPETPAAPPTAVLEPDGSWEESLQSTLEAAKSTGRAEIILTEAQLTSMIRSELEGQDNVPIRSPQLSLQDGQIQVTGTVERQGIALNSRLALAPEINENGKLRFRVVSASFGLLPLPADMLADLQRSIDRNFSAEIDALTEEIIIEGVAIDAGKMAISGRLK